MEKLTFSLNQFRLSDLLKITSCFMTFHGREKPTRLSVLPASANLLRHFDQSHDTSFFNPNSKNNDNITNKKKIFFSPELATERSFGIKIKLNNYHCHNFTHQCRQTFLMEKSSLQQISLRILLTLKKSFSPL